MLSSYSAARVAKRVPPPAVAGWRRTNFRGREVTLSTGGAVVFGLLAGLGASPAGLLAVGSAAAAGAYDDLVAPRFESDADKGLRGHLNAARSGRPSGGVVKVAAIGAGAVAAASLLPGPRTAYTVVSRAALIAGTANLLNLFDLRPGRASKIALVAGLSGVLSPNPPTASVSAAITGSVMATISDDLGEVGMLGDLGANALGAAIGLRLALLPPGWRAVALVKVVGLTLLSERVSFSRVIESVPALRRLDQLGRS